MYACSRCAACQCASHISPMYLYTPASYDQHMAEAYGMGKGSREDWEMSEAIYTLHYVWSRDMRRQGEDVRRWSVMVTLHKDGVPITGYFVCERCKEDLVTLNMHSTVLDLGFTDERKPASNLPACLEDVDFRRRMEEAYLR